jgi:aldehyde:ferredoxin oxidoreductase
MFNLREGWTRAEDWLPDRFLSESLELESGRKATLTADRLQTMISLYYRDRGLEPSGVPTPSTVAELQLQSLIPNGRPDADAALTGIWTSRF